MKAECPKHGPQEFVYVSQCDWWECESAGMFEPDSCGSVIPQECITPDGADVYHWQQGSWVQPSDGPEFRTWSA